MVELFDAEGHLFAGRDQQGGEADGGGVGFDGFVDDFADRDLFAEVVDGVAVVGEDGVDEVLADVVDVAEDGGEDDGAFGDAFLLLQVGLQWETAFFIASADWSTNGRISSPAPNLSPTSFMAGRRTLLRTSTAVAGFGDGLIESCFDAVFLAVEDPVVESFADGDLGHGVGAG